MAEAAACTGRDGDRDRSASRHPFARRTSAMSRKRREGVIDPRPAHAVGVWWQAAGT